MNRKRVNWDMFKKGLQGTTAKLIGARKKVALFGIVVIALIFGVHYYVNSQSATVVLSLNYPQASEGLYPNGTRFNVFELQSEEVLTKTLSYAGLTDKVTVEDLKDAVSVKQYRSSDIKDADSYITTSYRITVSTLGLTREVSARDLTDFLCKSYKEYFRENYADNQDILSFSYDSMDSEEYLTKVDLLKMRATQLMTYTQTRIKENKNFTDEESGESFSSIQKKLQNFIDYDVANLSAYILENGLAHSKSEVTALIGYRVRMNAIDYDKEMAAYNVEQDGIEMYDEAMSAAVLVPTKNTDQEYYMSRTKTEMDYLSDDADYHLSAATSIAAEINRDKYLISQIKEGENAASKRKTADEKIIELESYVDELADTLDQVDDAYIQYKTKDYLSCRDQEKSIKDRLSLGSSLAEILIVLVLGFVILYARELKAEMKEKEVSADEGI